LLVLCLGAFEAAIFQLDYQGYLERALTQGQGYGGSVGGMFALIPLGGSLLLTLAFFWFSLRSSRNVRWVYFAIFCVACLCEYGYQGAYHRFSSPEDFVMIALFASPTLYKDTLLGWLNWTALAPIAVYGATLAVAHKTQPGSARLGRLLVLLGLIGGFYSAMFQLWLSNPQGSLPMPSTSSFFRTVTSLPWKISQSYYGPRDPIRYRADQAARRNIIFIVDESVRGDHLSLNGYARPTTPFLDALQQRGLLFNWGAAASGTTCSLGSNNLLLSGVTSLPDRENAIKKQPSIFQYAKASGYTTYYLDGASSIFWNGTNDDLRYIDHWENAERFAGDLPYDADERIAERVRALVTSSTGNFIWINKRGTHFHYNNTFPQDAPIWTPIYNQSGYNPAMHDELVNSYDNAVRYNLGSFFETLLSDRVLLDNTTIIYTSDHGQTLSDHQETTTHCGASRNEALVPLFMITTQFHPQTSYRASHANLFATLLDIMAFPEAERHYVYAPSLLQAPAGEPPVRRYFVGAIDGTSGGGFYDFDRN
jgi:glucan phosphoethanolaminetransferase (alkaline phosphatase superfamily)